MERPSPRLIFFAVLLVLSSSVIVASVASASSSYDVSVANSIDVPDRTEEIEVNYRGLPVRVEFDITSVGRVEPGEDIDVDTIGPENESYDVIKASGDEEITSVSLTGDNSTTFSTDGDDPGTYLVAVQVGNTELSEKAVPVVVAAYDAELTIPDEAAPGETVNATIELEPYDEEPAIDSVELVLMDGDDPDRIEANATNPSEDIYEAEVTVPESEGDYTVFSTVFGEESLSESEQEMLEITKTSIEVTEDAADDDSDDNNNNVSDPDDGNETNTSDPDDGTETNVTDPDDGNETNVTDPDDGNETNVTDPDDGNETNTSDPDDGNETNVSDPDEGDSDDVGTGGGAPDGDGSGDKSDDGEGESDEGSGDTVTEVVQQAQATAESDAETGGARATFDEGSPVEEIDFKSDVEGTVNVTTRESEPADVEPPSGTAVQVSEITVPEDARNSPATIRMTVDTARLEEHDATAEELRVERFSDGTWESLETTVVDVGNDRVVLEAETPGFSMFAVTAEEDAGDDGSTSTDGDDDSEDESTGSGDDDGSTGTDGEDDSDDGMTEDDTADASANGSDEVDDGSEDGDGVTEDDTPGFGVLGALVAVTMLAAAAVTRNRRSN